MVVQMISPEQLINDLQKQIIKLEGELAQAQKDIEDFEVLAKEWRKGHQDLEYKHKREVMELNQVIQELEEELRENARLMSGIYND